MKQAVLDIGTNSVRLLVAETVADETTTLRKDIRATRLGDGLAAGEPLNEAAKNRTLTGIQELVDEAREAGVERWSIVGTNALREASDGEAFAQQVAQLVGAPVRIISGVDEARYGYLGAVKTNSLVTAVVDIGGGSTEIGVGFGGDLGAAVSMPLGAVRGTRDFDMMTPRGIAELKKHCFAVLKEATTEVQGVKSWIGVGGTMTSIVSMLLELEPYDAEKVQGYVLAYEDLHTLRERLTGMSYEERTKLPGLARERADIIVAGAVIAESLQEYFALPEITVSDQDLLEGIYREAYLL